MKVLRFTVVTECSGKRGARRHSAPTPEAWSGEGVQGEQLVYGIGTGLVTLPFG